MRAGYLPGPAESHAITQSVGIINMLCVEFFERFYKCSKLQSVDFVIRKELHRPTGRIIGTKLVSDPVRPLGTVIDDERLPVVIDNFRLFHGAGSFRY